MFYIVLWLLAATDLTDEQENMYIAESSYMSLGGDILNSGN